MKYLLQLRFDFGHFGINVLELVLDALQFQSSGILSKCVGCGIDQFQAIVNPRTLSSFATIKVDSSLVISAIGPSSARPLGLVLLRSRI